jgi:hypothetical protein
VWNTAQTVSGAGYLTTIPDDTHSSALGDGLDVSIPVSDTPSIHAIGPESCGSNVRFAAIGKGSAEIKEISHKVSRSEFLHATSNLQLLSEFNRFATK